MNKVVIEEKFDEMNKMFSELAAGTALDEMYLRKRYVKQSDPRAIFGGENTWNDFRGAFTGAAFRKEELARAGLTAQYEKAQNEPDRREYDSSAPLTSPLTYYHLM